jgi:hypothetical protein
MIDEPKGEGQSMYSTTMPGCNRRGDIAILIGLGDILT